MSLKQKLVLAAACAAGIGLASTSAALAQAPQGFAGTLSGSYGNLSAGGGNADLWGADGQAAFGLGMSDLGAEVDGGYHNLSGGGGNLDIYNIGGHVFWSPAQMRLGGTVQYQSLDTSGANIHITNYGGFGEFFASENVTLGLNAGGWSGSAGGGNSSGGYVGGGASFYIMPNLALTGLINYFGQRGGHLTSYSAQLEWLVSESMPVSVFGGYTNTDASGPGGSIDQWLIGVKFYTDGNGNSLVAKHRNGALDSLVRPSLRIFN